MTIDELILSAENDGQPPAELSPELRTLWFIKADQWEAAHNIAQDIHTPMGAWLHALLHLIEGDVGNAGYWFRQAGKPKQTVTEIDGLWLQIARQLLSNH